MTKRQRNQVKQRFRGDRSLRLVPLIGLSVLVLLVGLSIGWEQRMLGGLALIFAILILVTTAFDFLYMARSRTLNHVLDKGQVNVEKGRVELYAKSLRGYRAEYIVAVGRRQFVVTEREFLGFREGEQYLIYYLPHLDYVLSAEGLEDKQKTSPADDV